MLAIAVTVAMASATANGAANKLPRFASVRAGEVNVRTGPGVRYPVEWVFVYRNMPVEIVAEFDTWRKVRDWDGTEGWIHRSMLSGSRTMIVVGGTRPIRRNAEASSDVVAQVEERVIGRLLDCMAGWCRVEVSGMRGWMSRNHIWGGYSKEKVE